MTDGQLPLTRRSILLGSAGVMGGLAGCDTVLAPSYEVRQTGQLANEFGLAPDPTPLLGRWTKRTVEEMQLFVLDGDATMSTIAAAGTQFEVVKQIAVVNSPKQWSLSEKSLLYR